MGQDTEIASGHFVIRSPPMSLVALESRLVSTLPFSFDLQSADGKVLLSASGENLPKNAPSIPVRMRSGTAAQRDFGRRRSRAGKTAITMRWPAVAAIARMGNPAPQAMPIAAVIQTVAAVVRPFTMSLRTKMTPPPMKPMPETICAAIREGSRTTRSCRRTFREPIFRDEYDKCRGKAYQRISAEPSTLLAYLAF